MVAKSYTIAVFDLLISLSTALDLMSPQVSGHHKRVAYIALALGRRLELLDDELRELVIAASLHDVGAFSQAEREAILRFENDANDAHAIVGYEFLRRFPLFAGIASVVRYHHLDWDAGKGCKHDGVAVPRNSHLLHLADRIDAAIDHGRPILLQVANIRELIVAGRGSRFRPEFVDAFIAEAERESFWLDLSYPRIEQLLNQGAPLGELVLDIGQLESLAQALCHLIDFKSPYTATHSMGVAATATLLSWYCGFSEADQREMGVAGLLHDVGKLVLPGEVLNKRGPLTTEEFSTVRAHAYYSLRTLEGIADLARIVAWGANHHERLDGRGYPFHSSSDELSLGARIVAVADVFTALSEVRPYRDVLTRSAAQKILDHMGETGKLDPALVSLVDEHYNEIQRARARAQQQALKDYQELAARLPLPAVMLPAESAAGL